MCTYVHINSPEVLDKNCGMTVKNSACKSLALATYSPRSCTPSDSLHWTASPKPHSSSWLWLLNEMAGRREGATGQQALKWVEYCKALPRSCIVPECVGRLWVAANGFYEVKLNVDFYREAVDM